MKKVRKISESLVYIIGDVMKKIRRIPRERIPAFIAYALVVVCVIGGFTAGKHCLFTGGAMYIIGMILDPKSDLYRKD